MNTIAPQALHVQSDETRRTYATLLSQPHRVWTISDLARLLPDVSVNRLRTMLLLLLGEHLMEIEVFARQHSLALRLNRQGEHTLAGILRGTEDGVVLARPPAIQGGRNAS
ncbi:hypothetical protein AB0M47_15990 [Hamadaea sp. NPDC051192]|uniref:hypothetical protein n=1 Tax=Hamadaea sp. NPDC051192 TaxID=3154940 RepID=UPI0034160676